MNYAIEILKEQKDGLEWVVNSLKGSDKSKQNLADVTQALQLLQTGVSCSIYGYTLEIKSKNYKGNWFRHYNNKLYKTKDSAENAIEQMKDYPFYSNFEWRIVALYCH